MSINNLFPFCLLLFFFCTNELTFPDAVSNMVADAKIRVLEEGNTGLNFNLLEGVQCPNFKLKELDGNEFNSSSLKGHFSFVNFWFTDCPGCITEVPHLNKLEDEYGEQIQFISICRDDSIDVSNFLSKHEWHFKHLVNGTDVLKKDFMGILGYPTSFLLNEDAKIVQVIGLIGDQNYETILNEIKSEIE